jgi:menaquinone-dependent protoporphyrinogen oxidase
MSDPNRPSMDTNPSSTDILVAYGSKHGATAEIAQRIGEVLRADGLTVEVCPAEQVGRLEGYRAVVLGSAVYALRWRREARRLLRLLLRHPVPGQEVWLFSSGPLDDDPHEPEKIVSKRVREAAEHPAVHEHRIFAGRYPIEPSNFVERSMVKNAPADRRDFRDWAQVEGWAHAIAAALRHEVPRAA